MLMSLPKVKGWLAYELPEQYRRYHSIPLCIGQKQRWFLLKLICPDSAIHLDATTRPEFDSMALGGLLVSN